MSDDARLKTVVNSWLTNRDRMAARHRVGLDTRQSVFLKEFDGHAEQLREILPSMSLAEMEAFSELVYQMLSLRRIRELSFHKSN